MEAYSLWCGRLDNSWILIAKNNFLAFGKKKMEAPIGQIILATLNLFNVHFLESLPMTL